jgi:hypothetical protein
MSDIPFAEIESPFFQQMILCATDLRYDLILSHSTISSDVQKLHSFAKSWVISKVKVCVLLYLDDSITPINTNINYLLNSKLHLEFLLQWMLFPQNIECFRLWE